MFDHDSLRPNTTSWLVYSECAPKPAAKILQDFYPWDDTELVPSQPMSVVSYDQLVEIDVNFTDFNGINLAIMNNCTYVAPNVPALFTAMTNGADAVDPDCYGNSTNSFVLDHLNMVYLAINNDDTGGHPCIPHIEF
jgi:iron transport multicopper oxidase